MLTLYDLFMEYERCPKDEKINYLEDVKIKQPDTYKELIELLEVDAEFSEESLSALVQNSIAAVCNDQVVELEKGTIIGAFSIESILGRGGMGAVYLAKRNDGNFEQLVAIKFLNPLLTYHKSSELILLEAQSLSQLNHPHIAKVLMVEHTNDKQVCLVMEYINGESLEDYLIHSSMSLEQKLILFNKILHAVQHAHTQKIVHGDLKPSNILVTKEGEPKLIDFGVSRKVDASTDSKVIFDYLCALSYGYTSPEVLRGQFATTLSDVYSLGAILQFLVQGNVMEKKKNNELSYIIARCLSSEAVDRYATPEAISNDIQLFKQRRPINGVKYHCLQKAFLFYKRNKFSSIVSAFIILLSILSLVSISVDNIQLKKESKVGQMALQSSFKILKRFQPSTQKETLEEMIREIDDLESEVDWKELSGMSTVYYANFLAKTYANLNATEKAISLLEKLEYKLSSSLAKNSHARFVLYAHLFHLYNNIGNVSKSREYFYQSINHIDGTDLTAEEFLSSFNGYDSLIRLNVDKKLWKRIIDWLNNRNDIYYLSFENEYLYNMLNFNYYQDEDVQFGIRFLLDNYQLSSEKKGKVPVTYIIDSIAKLKQAIQVVDNKWGVYPNDEELLAELEYLLSQRIITESHPEFPVYIKTILMIYKADNKYIEVEKRLLKKYDKYLSAS